MSAKIIVNVRMSLTLRGTSDTMAENKKESEVIMMSVMMNKVIVNEYSMMTSVCGL